ncbi:MAG: hypothetical protein M3430_11710 [Acidobacteriota bacterium]|nr:hypothetical protein [Acidobacteriota bacterium]
MQEAHKQEYAQTQAAASESAPNFIPGASPVGESNSQARSRATGKTGQINESANSTSND